jgi:hypothetical protein
MEGTVANPWTLCLLMERRSPIKRERLARPAREIVTDEDKASFVSENLGTLTWLPVGQPPKPDRSKAHPFRTFRHPLGRCKEGSKNFRGNKEAAPGRSAPSRPSLVAY